MKNYSDNLLGDRDLIYKKIPSKKIPLKIIPSSPILTEKS
jgi:hypothetical protein